MQHGPCGGVTPDHTCEVDANLPCPYFNVLKKLPWRNPDLAHVPLLSEQTPQSQGRLEASLRAGDFVHIAEVYTPDSTNVHAVIDQYMPWKQHITAVNIAEHALATPHASTLAAAALFERAGIETIINLTCRDRNRIALQGELLGAAALGVRNIFCITGDHPARGDHPDARAVFELDAFGLIRLTAQLRDQRQFASGRPLEQAPEVFIGAAANPFSPPETIQAERVAAKVAAGARFIQTQGIFDIAGLEAFCAQLRVWGVLERAYLIAGVAIVTSAAQARWLRDAVPGARVPEGLITDLERLSPAEQRRQGVMYAATLTRDLQALSGVSGALLFPLQGDVASIGEVLDLLE